jgi:hypothetical protein
VDVANRERRGNGDPGRRKNLSLTDARVGAVDYYSHPAAPAVASNMQRFRRPLYTMLGRHDRARAEAAWSREHTPS